MKLSITFVALSLFSAIAFAAVVPVKRRGELEKEYSYGGKREEVEHNYSYGGRSDESDDVKGTFTYTIGHRRDDVENGYTYGVQNPNDDLESTHRYGVQNRDVDAIYIDASYEPNVEA